MRDISNRQAGRIIQDWKIQLKAELAALFEERTLELFHRLKQSEVSKEQKKET